MRLVCPKCVAQYEVDDQAIPEEGREVQCANCEHIWFQDRLQMFTEKEPETPEAATVEAAEKPDTEIFDDLDGVGDVEFRRHRDDAPREPVAEDPDDAIENILADDPDDNTPLADTAFNKAIDPEVRAVLQDEARFSGVSEPEVAAPAPDLPAPESKAEAETTEPEPEETPATEPDELEDLAAFLDAHARPAPEPEEPAAEEGGDTELPFFEADTNTEKEDSFDPLSDLDAIRSQLDSIRTETEEPEYTPVLPRDNDIIDAEEILSDEDYKINLDLPDLDATITGEATQDDSPALDISNVADNIGAALDDIPEEGREANDIDFDDIEPPSRRRAFRADGAGTNEAEARPPQPDAPFFVEEDKPDNAPPADEVSGPETETEDGQEPLSASATAALAAFRPRTDKGRAQVGTITTPQETGETTRETVKPATAKTPAEIFRPVQPGRAAKTERPAAKRPPKPERISRKELLPDVEELDSALRGEPPALTDTDKIAEPSPGKSFGRSFVRTLSLIVILGAVYLLRPMIIEKLPAAAVVLDPYAGFVDSMRLGIENLVNRFSS